MSAQTNHSVVAAVTPPSEWQQFVSAFLKNRGATVGLAAGIRADLREAFARLAKEPADLKAFGILIATGASPRKLGFEGEAEYAGR